MSTRKVGTIKHEKYGIEVALRLDTDSMVFEATWVRHGDHSGFPQRHMERSKDGEEVRDNMLAYIDAQMSIRWEPVIEVVPLHDHAQGDQVRATAACAMSVTRFWLGRPAVGDMQRVAWTVEAAHRTERSQSFYVPDEMTKGKIWSKDFQFPYRAKQRHSGLERIYLTYTEELWAGLALIEQRITEARTMLEQMLGTDDAIGRVAELGATMLPDLLAPPAPADVVHALRAGRPLCGFTEDEPREWPVGHRWTDPDDAANITCAACIAAVMGTR